MQKISLFSLPMLLILSGCFSDSSTTNGGGSADTLTISYKHSALICKKGVTISPDSLSITGATALSYGLSTGSALPAGLSLNAASGLISGKPNTIQTQNLTFTFPASPAVATAHQSTSLGPIDVAESALDAYHGHFSATAEDPSGIYHYHVTATSPYINGGQFYGTPGTVTQ